MLTHISARLRLLAKLNNLNSFNGLWSARIHNPEMTSVVGVAIGSAAEHNVTRQESYLCSKVRTLLERDRTFDRLVQVENNKTYFSFQWLDLDNCTNLMAIPRLGVGSNDDFCAWQPLPGN